MMTSNEATEVANSKTRPRVLVLRTFNDDLGVGYVRSEAGTLDTTYDVSNVALNEWDVVVAHTSLSSLWALPDHIAVFCVVNVDQYSSVPLVPLADGGAVAPHWLRWIDGVAGAEVRIPPGLPEPLRDLVSRDLVRVADKRYKQRGLVIPNEVPELEPYVRKWRPFLVGPSGLVLGASFVRPSGAPMWVIPSDVPDLKPWLALAFDDWSADRPKTFPDRAVWTADPQWMSGPEAALHDELSRAANAQRETTAAHAELLESFDQRLEAAQAADAKHRRHLLTEDGDALQGAVFTALTDLGFQVADMDLEWPPDSRLEDYRVHDDDHPGWLALGDATGTVNGAKYSKFGALQTHASKSALREKWESSPSLWLIVNQLRYRTPEARGALFTNDEAMLIKDANGLAIDTCALFVLLRWSDGDADRAKRARDWLITLGGQVGLPDARQWIDAQK